MIRIACGVALAAVWFCIGFFLPPIGYLIAVIHIVCFLLDAGMNGLRYAEFAGMNAIGAALMLAGAVLGSPADAHADSMLGTNPVAPPPLGAPLASLPSPTTGEKWIVQVLLTVNGEFKGRAEYETRTFPSGDACAKAVLNDVQLKSQAATVANDLKGKYGPTASTVIMCAMELE